MEEKTNVMRVLDKAGVRYIPHSFPADGSMTGQQIAEIIGYEPGCVFKTLVTIGKTKVNYVFVIPVDCELDLKKAAKAVREKSIEMIKSKELLPTTGYIHGGCSPIGMKKRFKTVFHETAETFPAIVFSAGKIGRQVEMSTEALKTVIDFDFADIVVEAQK